jgi:hypothetical protein
VLELTSFSFLSRALAGKGYPFSLLSANVNPYPVLRLKQSAFLVFDSNLAAFLLCGTF